MRAGQWKWSDYDRGRFARAVEDALTRLGARPADIAQRAGWPREKLHYVVHGQRSLAREDGQHLLTRLQIEAIGRGVELNVAELRAAAGIERNDRYQPSTVPSSPKDGLHDEAQRFWISGEWSLCAGAWAQAADSGD